jgi:hypothetical protein
MDQCEEEEDEADLVVQETEQTDEPKAESGGDVRKVESRGDEAKVESGSDVAKVESGGDDAKVESGSDDAKVESSSDDAKVESGCDVTKAGSCSDVAKVESGSDEAKLECQDDEDQQSGKSIDDVDVDEDCGLMDAEEMDDERVEKESRAYGEARNLSGNPSDDMNGVEECVESGEVERESGRDTMAETTRGEEEIHGEENDTGSSSSNEIDNEDLHTRVTGDSSREAIAGKVENHGESLQK